MKVLLSDIIFEKADLYGSTYSWIIGQLQSGLEVQIYNFYYDLQEYIGQHVEMLLCVLRSPYLELKKGIINQPFSPEKYYSIELIEELEDKSDYNSENNERKHMVLTGEFIDSYIIPQEWIPLIKSKWFKGILKNASAIHTNDGIFILYPFHLRKKVPMEKFPKIVSIGTGRIDLAAWYPLSVSE